MRRLGRGRRGRRRVGTVASAPPTYDPANDHWPGLFFAFAGTTTFDDWNGSTSPALAEVTDLLNGSASENADKAGIVWPASRTSGGVTRVYRGALDGTTGNITQPNSSSSQVAGSTLTYSTGDWITVGATGTVNPSSVNDGITRTRGEWYLYNGTSWVLSSTCPHLDLPTTGGTWTVSNGMSTVMKNNANPYQGHALHYGGWWHKGGVYWLNHSLWNLTDATAIKNFISAYLHWNCQAIKNNFDTQGKVLIQMDGINEPFDEDIDTVSAVKEPGLRGWNRTFPTYTLEESPWHYAATQVTDWGANNVERILTLWQYTFQVLNQYFPGIKIGFNDFGIESRRYVTNSLQHSTPDVNGNTANQTVWIGHQQGAKLNAVEYYMWRMMTHNEDAPLSITAADTGATWVPPRAMGFQFHIEPKNQVTLPYLAYWMNRMTYLGDGVEIYMSEINHRGEHTITQNAGTITITTGAGGDTITSIKAYYPTTQTGTFNELLSGTVNWTTSNDNTASLIATSINNGTGTHNYIASASANVVQVYRSLANARGFDLGGVTKTGSVTVTTANSRVNNPSNVAPMFRQYYKTSSLSNNRTLWTFGWNDSNKKFWEYGTWITESWIRMALRNSRIRFLKWWTPDGGLAGNPISLWDYSYVKSTSYDAMERIMASADWKRPSDRVIPRRCRMDFTWYKYLHTTTSNVTVDTNGAGHITSSATGTFTSPWTWWSAIGLTANDFVGVLQYTSVANPASGTILWTLYNGTDRVDLYFSNASGQISMRSITGGVTRYDVVAGTQTASARNIIAFRISSGSGKVSLNNAAVVTGTGTSAIGTTMSFGFDHTGANGYNGCKFEIFDAWSNANVSGDAGVQALSQQISLTNPWPLWDGTTAYPALQTE